MGWKVWLLLLVLIFSTCFVFAAVIKTSEKAGISPKIITESKSSNLLKPISVVNPLSKNQPVKTSSSNLNKQGAGFTEKTQISPQCGDLNYDGVIDVFDLTFLTNYIFSNGVTPEPAWIADMNGDGVPNVLDINILKNYIFSNGDKPLCGKSLENDDFVEDKIITRGNKKYIIRDGIEYLLSEKSLAAGVTAYIQFNPPLPNSTCENELINITVNGITGYYPDTTDVAYCISHDHFHAYWCLNLMEADLVGDDTVDFTCDWSDISCSDILSNPTFYFEHKFENVKLSDWIVAPEPGSNGEFYAKIYNVDGKVSLMSTSTYNVYGYISGECACISGACCDMRVRPYGIKSSGTQPTGIADLYYCEGINSPTDTSYVKLKDFYCNGVSTVAQSSISTVNTCGLCSYCQAPNCVAYPEDTQCGTVSCDYQDTICRDYHDVGKFCSATAQCRSDPCWDYTDAPAGTSCGVNQACDGNGNCVNQCECTSGACCDGCHYRTNSYVCDSQYALEYGCPNGEGTNFPGSDVFKRVKQRYCTGTSSSCSGTISNWLNWILYSDCTSNQYCINTNPSCNDCGTHTLSSCYDNDVYWYDNCNNLEDKKQECGNTGYIGSNYCYDNDVYRDYQTNGCSAGSCTSSTDKIKQLECGTSGCSGGACNQIIICSSNSQCGTDGWTGAPSCSSDDLYQAWRTNICNNPGTPSSYCSYSDANLVKQDCGSDEYSANYCYDNDVYRDFTDRGCSGTSCFVTTTKQKVSECGTNGCSSGQCIVPSSEGYLLVSDRADKKIYQITPTGTFVNSINLSIPWPMSLAMQGAYLWIDDSSTKNIYQMTTDGRIISSFSSPGDSIYGSPQGLAWDGMYLWHVHSGNKKLYKLTTSGLLLNTYEGQINSWGLAWDGSYLYMSGGVMIYKLDTNGNLVNTYSTTFFPSDLTWDGNYFWGINGTRIFKLTSDFQIVDSFDSPGKSSFGIAWQPISSCVPGTNYHCQSGDVYNFDSCNRLESKKEECGGLYCINRICAGETYTKSLPSGWSQATLPGVPVDNSVKNVLLSIDGKYNSVWAFVNGSWLSYSPTVLPLMNTLKKIDTNMAFQIEMKQAATLSFLYYPGNIKDISNACELSCTYQSYYDFCSRERDLEIEGEHIKGTCNLYVKNYPGFGIKACPVIACP